jgi:L-fucose isomerase-like protein
MVDYKVKIGLAPCRRNLPKNMAGGFRMWGQAAAIEMKDIIMPYLRDRFMNEHVEFVDIDWLTEDGMMTEYEQAPVIADRFIAEKIDALFVININFGEEEVAAKLAQLCNVPTLIWAPQDTEFGEVEDKRLDNPDYGMRLLDAQCGLFATSKLMQRYHVKFTHIPTCHVQEDCFAEAFEDFLAVTCMLKNWKKMRVMQLGNRPKAFTSMMFNEDELLEKFGVEVFPMTGFEAASRVTQILNDRSDELDPIVQQIRSFYTGGDGGSNEALRKNAAILLMYRDLFNTTGCSAISCDSSFARAIGGGGGLDMAMAAQENKFVSFESDMHGVIMMVLMSCATMGEKKPFFGEFTANHPTNPNAELLWHGSIFPPAVAGRESFEPYILTGFMGGNAGFEVARGTYTIGRLDCMGGKYAMLLGNYEGVPGPFTRGCYQWGEFKDWKKFEQATMYGPYVHHMVEIEGGERLVTRFKEFCRFTGIYADIPDERDTPFAPFFYKM